MRSIFNISWAKYRDNTSEGSYSYVLPLGKPVEEQ